MQVANPMSTLDKNPDKISLGVTLIDNYGKRIEGTAVPTAFGCLGKSGSFVSKPPLPGPSPSLIENIRIPGSAAGKAKSDIESIT